MQFNSPTSTEMKTKNMTTLHLRKSIGRSLLLRAFFLIALTLAWFALLPSARAVDPPPDGFYGNESTAEGENALFSCQTCNNLTAIGFQALFSNTTGEGNTAIGTNVL